ncbi:MAG: hypothetical protein DRR19_23160, partial [Candidatus Parabeggiatoa sp. nov. 1]
MKLNFNKRDPVMPDTNLGPPKTRRRNKTLARAISLALLAGSVHASAWAATIEGSKFVDNNNSGVKDANEGVAGDTIYMKPVSAPSFFRPRRDVTDENGDFGFYGLPTGDYKVWEASNQPSGVQTLSSSEQDAKIITIDDSEQAVSLDFELNPYPVVKIVSSVDGPVVLNAGDSFTFDISVQDADSETVNLYWSIWDGGQNYQYGHTEGVGIPYSQQITHEVSSDHRGMLYVYVSARDEQRHGGYDNISLSSLALKLTSPSEPVEIAAGETLNFTASLEDLTDGPSDGYFIYWSFGTRGWNSWSNSKVQAGTSEVTASYLYETGGSFPVRVYVSDNQGRWVMDTINVEVEGEPNTPPKVAVSLQPDEQEKQARNTRSGVEIEVDSPESLTAGEQVNFKVNIDDPDTTNTYRISVGFGDGGWQQIETTSPEEREIDISYTYSGGDFTVWVYVQDSAGGYVNG